VADRRASTFFFLVVVLAVAAAGWLLFKGSGAEPVPAPAPAAPAPAAPGTAPAAPGPKGRPGARRPRPPAAVVIEPVAPTREACLEFLRGLASAFPPPAPGKGMRVILPAVRMEAMDALAAVDPAAAEPLVLAALGGDGDPSDWSEERLHAAGLRILAGRADGAETVKAWLKSGEDLSTAALQAARAASLLPPAEGAPAVRRLLGEKFDEYADEDVVAILQAAATLGDGASAAELRKIAGPAGDETRDAAVRGAAAGALVRLGDPDAGKVLDGLDEFDAEEAAKGLGARGNGAAIPLLERLLRSEDGDVRTAAVRSLAEVGGPGAVAAVRGALKDPEPDARAWAAIALALLGGREALPEVRRAAGDRDAEMAAAAWKALALLGDGEAREAAGKLLSGGAGGPPETDRGSALLKRVWAAALVVKTAK
jgi:HEAT repeat protein